MAPVAASGKPAGGFGTWRNIMDICAVGRGASQSKRSGRVVTVDDLVPGSPDDSGNTVGTIDATRDPARWRQRYAATKICNPEIPGQPDLHRGKSRAIGSNAGVDIEIQIVCYSTRFASRITHFKYLRVQRCLVDARWEKDCRPSGYQSHLVGCYPVS